MLKQSRISQLLAALPPYKRSQLFVQDPIVDTFVKIPQNPKCTQHQLHRSEYLLNNIKS